MAENFRRTLSSSSLMGTPVTNSQNEDLGEIEEIMIDVTSGRVAYVVLSFGGFMGLGDKLFAVPWHAFEVDEKQERFLLNKTKEDLKNAPGFDKKEWPDFAPGSSLLDEIGTFYGEGGRSQETTI